MIIKQNNLQIDLSKEQEDFVRKALRKSAKELKVKGQTISDIDVEDALINICQWYSDNRHRLLAEAEKRARNKMSKFYKEMNN
jgi:predicted nucleotidyltransferase